MSKGNDSRLAWFVAIAAMVAPVVVFFDTARSIVSIWSRSETFAHGYIIVPISLWLIWRQRSQLAAVPVMPCWPALFMLGGCGIGWMLATLADVQVVQQYAVVAMIPLGAIAVLGLAVARIITFPLLFLLLAVPFGEVFIDPLIAFTADFTVAALQLTGIPVLRNGVSFEIPSGSWSVVSACSGVRYLIASFTLGCLYAHLTYRSRRRQLIFIVLSVVVPIIANGVRAYLIVMIGHLSGMSLAVGVDHLIYGWVFFGLVMLLLFWLGSFWREDTGNAPNTRMLPLPSLPHGLNIRRTSIIGVSVLTCLLVWPIYVQYTEKRLQNLPIASFANFEPVWRDTMPFTNWTARFSPANAEFRHSYENDKRQVGLNIFYYRNQHRGSLLISSTNQLVSEEDRNWHKRGTERRTENISGTTLTVRETVIEGEGRRLLVWSWYWIDGRFTANDYVGKMLQAKGRLLMHGDDGAAIIVFAPYDDDLNQARELMRAFVADHADALNRTLNENSSIQLQ